MQGSIVFNAQTNKIINTTRYKEGNKSRSIKRAQRKWNKSHGERLIGFVG